MTYNGENLWAGQLGHAAVLLSFVASVIALISYSFASFGKKHNPTHRPVESMNDTAKNIPRLGVLLFEIIFQSIAKWLIAGFISLHQLSGFFINDHKMIVFINNLMAVKLCIVHFSKKLLLSRNSGPIKNRNHNTC